MKNLKLFKKIVAFMLITTLFSTLLSSTSFAAPTFWIYKGKTVTVDWPDYRHNPFELHNVTGYQLSFDYGCGSKCKYLTYLINTKQSIYTFSFSIMDHFNLDTHRAVIAFPWVKVTVYAVVRVYSYGFTNPRIKYIPHTSFVIQSGSAMRGDRNS